MGYYFTYTLFRSNFFTAKCMQIYDISRLMKINCALDFAIEIVMGGIFTGGTRIKSLENYVIDNQTKNYNYTLSYIDDSYEVAYLDLY